MQVPKRLLVFHDALSQRDRPETNRFGKVGGRGGFIDAGSSRERECSGRRRRPGQDRPDNDSPEKNQQQRNEREQPAQEPFHVIS
jgi:hypothetical protein